MKVTGPISRFVRLAVITILLKNKVLAFCGHPASLKNCFNVSSRSSESAVHLNLFPINSRGSSSPSVRAPEGFVAPVPKPLQIPDEEGQISSTLSGTAALALRLATSAFVLGWRVDSLFYRSNDGEGDKSGKYSLKLGPFSIRDSSSVLTNCPRPTKPLILYEYESSPYCRIVREAMNLLDITYECRPCPGARTGFSDEIADLEVGRRTVPYLVDPNDGPDVAVGGMFESSTQIRYLLDVYGPPPTMFDRKALWPIEFQQFALITSTLAALVRGLPASRPDPRARPDAIKMLPLVLWGYECSPFVRPVRERLSELCLPHQIVSCSRGSANRDAMIKKMGRFQVPFLEDPNTGIEMFESNEICSYLDAVYTVGDNK